MKDHTFLIHYGELGLKGQNRKDFENQLRKNISTRLEDVELSYSVILEYRYLTIPEVNPSDVETVTEILSSTFGIAWFTHAHILSPDSSTESITDTILALVNKNADPTRTFRISAKRANKQYPISSTEIEKEIGEAVLNKTSYEKVNLSNPDDIYHIEIDREAIFVFKEKHPGPGGMPVGTGGKALVLLSGGFDSPVASYLMAKRGCEVDFLHFYVKEPKEGDKITRIASQLSQYTGKGTVHLAPYLPFNMAILEAKTEYELVLFRRFMLRVGQKLAEKYGYDTIVTGDSLGQVASQTIENIQATEDALDDTLCLRPLISFDKSEIIEIAKELDIFEIAKEPDKDCCSIIDRHAKTKVTLEKIREEEKKISNYESVVNETLDQSSTIAIP